MKRNDMVLILLLMAVFMICGCSKAAVEQNVTVSEETKNQETEFQETAYQKSDNPEETGADEDITGASAEGNALETSYTEVEYSYITFEESIIDSSCCVIGEYEGCIAQEYYNEYEFRVTECLYGSVTDEVIYVHSPADAGTGYVEDTGYSFPVGECQYVEGNEYFLILEKHESLFWDHDRYYTYIDTFLCGTTGEYTMYSEPIEVPENMTLKEYIPSVRGEESPASAQEAESVEYADEIEEMLGESEFTGVVTVQELFVEGRVANSNTYTCTVTSLLSGGDLTVREDGTIWLTVFKNTVEPGNTYIIGFSHVSEGSYIYSQSTVTSVYEYSEELLSQLRAALEP